MPKTKGAKDKVPGKRSYTSQNKAGDMVNLHPKRKSIEADLADPNMTLAAVARKWELPRYAIQVHMRRMYKEVAIALHERRVDRGNYVLDTINKVTEKLERMLDACEDYLLDPDDPQKYNLGPRASEIEVIYYVPSKEHAGRRGAEGATARKKDKLQTLLNIALKDKYAQDVVVNYKYADPRVLLGSTADSVERQIRLLAQIQGKIKDASQEMTQVVLMQIQNVIVEATKDHPEIRKEIADAIRRIPEGR